MFDFHEKRKIRSFLYSRAVIFLFFSITVLLSFSVYNRYTVAEDMRAKLETRRAELDKLKERAQLLESKVDYLENERGVEEELRNRFDVIKEGEQVVILLDAQRNEQRNSSSSKENSLIVEQNRSFLDSLKFWQ